MEPTVNVSPNPNTGQFELVVFVPRNSTMKAVVYDMNGKLIRELGNFKTEDAEQKFRKTVPTGDLPAGMYNIVLFDNRKRYTTKMIKS
jgi:hypothetical protein